MVTKIVIQKLKRICLSVFLEADANSVLRRENKPRNSSESPELESTESKEDMRMQVHRDPASVEMDYILVTEEENMPSARESDFVFQEAVVPGQTESNEGFSRSPLDTFQSISIINEREDQSACGAEWDLDEKSSSVVVPQKLEDERESGERFGQDEGWIILGQNEVCDISSGEISAESEMPKFESGHCGKVAETAGGQESTPETQVEFQVETSFTKSFEHKSCASFDALSMTVWISQEHMLLYCRTMMVMVCGKQIISRSLGITHSQNKN